MPKSDQITKRILPRGIAALILCATTCRAQTGQVKAPDNPANKSARAQIAGRPETGGVHVDHDMRADPTTMPPDPVPPYKGSILKFDEGVKGEVGAFQRNFAAFFKDNDPQPQSRTDHFSWIPYGKFVTRIGWHGAITSVRRQADNSVVVIIKIQPYTYGGSAMGINDFVREKYIVSDGHIELVDTDAHDSTGHHHEWPDPSLYLTPPKPGYVPAKK